MRSATDTRTNNTLYAYSIPSVKGEPWNSEVNQRQSLLATLVSRTLWCLSAYYPAGCFTVEGWLAAGVPQILSLLIA